MAVVERVLYVSALPKVQGLLLGGRNRTAEEEAYAEESHRRAHSQHLELSISGTLCQRCLVQRKIVSGMRKTKTQEE